MTLRSLLLRATVGAHVVLVSATLAHAQATRTYVSGIGDDANPCSRTAPCKTFAGAYLKTATGGYLTVLDPGNYGTLTIGKSITIDGGPFNSTVIASGTNGIGVNSLSSKVVLRNLEIVGINNAGLGINVVAVTSLHLENVNIMNFTGYGISFNPVVGALLYVDHVNLRNTAGLFAANGRIEINELRARNNGKGVLAGANALVTIRDSVATGNGEGFASTQASAVFNIENSVVSHNQYGISASGGSTFRLSNTGVFSNSNTGLYNDGLSFIVSLSGNSVQGNLTAGSFTSTVLKQ